MAELYLVTPRRFDPEAFAPQLEAVLATHEVACLRLALESENEAEIRAAAEALRGICASHDIPLVISEHYRLAAELKIDGVHLDGTRNIRAARDALPKGAIVGAFCGTSRHTGMTAGEMGADYVSFGPVSASALGSGDVATAELFTWWSQMIEVPVVAEGRMTAELASSLSKTADFLAIGEEIWGRSDPTSALSRLLD